MLNAGFSLLKSFGKSGAKSKRKRDGATDSPGDPDTDSATKRARQRGSGGKQPNASFITSSVRKTKGKTSAASKKKDDEAAKNLQSKFQSVDEDKASGMGKQSQRSGKKGGKATRSGSMKSIFSPVFSFFAGGETEKANTRPSREKVKPAAGEKTKTKSNAQPTRSREAVKKPAAGTSARTRGRVPSGGTIRGSTDKNSIRTTVPEPTADDDASSDDDVPVERLVSPARGAGAAARGRSVPAVAESLESDEAEETESDDAVLQASGGTGVCSSRQTSQPSLSKHPAPQPAKFDKNNPNLAPDGSIIQNGFGKADLTLDDEYEYFDEMDEETYDEEYDPWIFIGGLPPLRSCVPKNRPKLLPPQSAVHVNKNTLVLDLDETLVHSDLEQTTGHTCDFSFPVHFNNQKHIVNVRRRPYLAEFMEFAARHFEVVVFTASQRVYAERLLDTLDPDNVLIKHRLYREACVLVDGNYMKDLSVIGRDLKNTIIVDNSPQAFGFQCDNGVPIESWFDDDNDRQLLKLIPLLGRLANAEDVRPVLKNKFDLHERIRVAEQRAVRGGRR